MAKKNQLTVAQYFSQQVDLCGKPQTDIAKEMGFDVPNVISNIKSGRTKLPLTRIGLAAKALGVDGLFLMKLALNEYLALKEGETGPTFWEVIEEANTRLITKEEFEIVEELRKETDDTNPRLVRDISRGKLKEFAQSLL